MKITIESIEVKEKKITKKDGSPLSFRLQEGWVWLGKSHPERVEFALWDVEPAYPLGDYVLDPASFMVNRYSSLELRRSIKLLPAGKGAK